GWPQKNPVSGCDVMITRSTGSGASWEPAVSPHSLYGHQIMPVFAVASGTLSVAWYDSRSEPAFDPDGPITGESPGGATDGTGATGIDVYYNQADTTAPGPLTFGTELRITSQSFN